MLQYGSQLKLTMFTILIIVFFSQSDAFRLNTATGVVGGPCEQAVKRAAAIEKATVVIDSPDNIHGKWVSEGCETRPGPEFLLRSYTFHPNSTFRLVQHYYADESCSSPVYTAVARGRLRPGGQYSLTRVGLIPHTAIVAQQLAAKIFSTCPGITRKRWTPFREYFILKLADESTTSNMRPFTTSAIGQEFPQKIHNKKGFKMGHPDSFNCLHSISLVFHELQHYKVRVKLGTDNEFDVTHYRQELLLGDIHSRIDGRASYKPTAYQVPLLKIDSSITDTFGLESDSLIRSDSLLNIDAKGVEESRGRVHEKSFVGHFDAGKVDNIDSITSSKDIKDEVSEKVLKKNLDIFHHCLVCSTIAAATEKSPPYLMMKPMIPLYLGGEWVSLNCENRPMGLYLTRHFKFYSGDNTWIVEYKFYSDTICAGSSFSVTAAGHFKKGKSSHRLPGASEVDFHLERASLTVFDPHMMEHLEKDPDCGVGSWKLGVPREMSSTHGCTTLGLVVPSIEYELLKMEVDFHGTPQLFMGQADTDNRRRGVKERPTAYQPPLVQCQNLPPYSESLRDILSSPLYSEDAYSSYDFRVLAMDAENSATKVFSFSSILITTIVLIFSL